MNYKTVKEIDLKGKRVLVRVDYNVPLDKQGHITDDARVVKSLPTINYILDQKPACVILMSHLGRPKAKPEPQYSLKPVADFLPKVLGKPIEFLNDCVGPEVEKKVLSKKSGEVLLLENLRFHGEEEKNDPQFSKQLAKLGEVYVDDAFGSAHRAHASVEGVTKYLPAVAGLLLEKEIVYFDRVLHHPEHPFVAILGGAKVSDKIKIVENLLEKVDSLIISGAMAYTFLKVQGHDMGSSKIDSEGLEIAKIIIEKAKKKNIPLYFPLDHIAANEFSEKAKSKVTSGLDIEAGWMGMDVGPKTIELFKKVLSKAKMVLWNGPLGVFEFAQFANGSRAIAEFIASCKMISIIGGGDTAASIKEFGLEEKMSHISTGGGASLEYLEGQVLPGVAALQKKQAVRSSV